MNTNINYTGAVRITPMVEKSLAERLGRYFEIRHMKRNVPMLEALYPTLEDQKAVTLMADGNFGPDGAFFMPTATCDIDFHSDCAGVEGLVDRMACNSEPEGCPGLYCELKLVAAPDKACSYLGWTGERTEDIAEWIALVASLLVPAGYHLDGKMFAIVENGEDYWQITVEDTNVQVMTWAPETTYEQEFQEAWEQE